MLRRISACLAVLLASGCAPRPTAPGTAPAEAAEPPPIVLATIFPVGDILAQLAGDDFEVGTLLSPGASPHTFELSPTQAIQLSRAEAVVAIGPGVDDWVVGKVPRTAQLLTLIDHTSLRYGFHHDHDHGSEPGAHDDHAHEDHEPGTHDDHEHGSKPEAAGGDAGHRTDGDPHIWLDPVRVRDDLAPAMAELLKSLRPAQAAAVDERLTGLQDDLTRLDTEITGLLGPVKDAAYVSAHAAWGYFDERYGLRMAAVIEEAPGKDPSGQRFGELLQRARAAGVRAVMAEEQQNRALAERLATDLRVPVGVLNPLGGSAIPNADSYRALLLHNAHEFAKVLSP